MSLLDRGDGLGEKSPRPPDHRIPGASGVARQNQCNQRLLVNPGQIQRFQADGHGLASQALRRRQSRRATSFQVLSQGRLILPR